jgi:hypothetical protein
MLYSFQPLIRIIIKVEEVKAIAKLFSQQYSNEIVVHNIHARPEILETIINPSGFRVFIEEGYWKRFILDKILRSAGFTSIEINTSRELKK